MVAMSQSITCNHSSQIQNSQGRWVGDLLSSKKDVVNAETARVLRDADAGKNLLNYASFEYAFLHFCMRRSALIVTHACEVQ